MALYEVTRTDKIQPGEFDSGYVIAGGTALARKMVAHLPGVQKDGKNVKAEKVDVAKVNMLLSAYFDERDTEVPF